MADYSRLILADEHAAVTEVTYTYDDGQLNPQYPTQFKNLPQNDDPHGNTVRYDTRPYVIHKAKPHRSLLTESAIMSAVVLPKPEAKWKFPHLPEQAILTGALSDAQLLTVILAHNGSFQAVEGLYRPVNNKPHQLEEPNEKEQELGVATLQAQGYRHYRKGFLLADSTGVGKGRQIAAIIFIFWYKGSTRAVWFAPNQHLFEAAQRDFRDIGLNPDILFDFKEIKQKDNIEKRRPHGVLFCTYAMLRQRVDQILKWLSGGQNPTIVFDEAQSLSGGNTESKGTLSQQASCAFKLQNTLFSAQIVYSSATAAMRPQDLDFCNFRLGLRARNSKAKMDWSSFASVINEKGEEAGGWIPICLKRQGLFVGRSLSFKGVDFELQTYPLSEEMAATYNQFVRLFSEIDAKIAAIKDNRGPANRKRKAAVGDETDNGTIPVFGPLKLQLLGSLITALKARSVIEFSQKKIDEGETVIYQIASTGESFLKSLSKGSKGQIDVSLGAQILHFIRSRLTDIMLEAELEALITAANALPKIDGFLDQIIWHFGADNVSECTGRTRRALDEAGERKIVPFDMKKSGEARKFMDGETKIMVFSRAGGVGASYHNLRTKDGDSQSDDEDDEIEQAIKVAKERRNHFLVQPDFIAQGLIQGLGRSHRTNQMNPPRYVLAVTDIPAEERFTIPISHAVKKIGMMMKGQERTGMHQLLGDKSVDYTSTYAAIGYKQLWERRIVHGKTGDSVYDIFQSGQWASNINGKPPMKMPTIAQFLLHILCLPLDEQKIVLDAWKDEIDIVSLPDANIPPPVYGFTAQYFECIGSRQLDIMIFGKPVNKVIPKKVVLINMFELKIARRFRPADKMKQLFSGRIAGYALVNGKPAMIIDKPPLPEGQSKAVIFVDDTQFVASGEDFRPETLEEDVFVALWNKSAQELQEKVDKKPILLYVGDLFANWCSFYPIDMKAAQLTPAIFRFEDGSYVVGLRRL